MTFIDVHFAFVLCSLWGSGEARKLRNHVHEVGLTRALCSTERLLASTSLDVDTGASWVHLRRLPDQRYLHSLRMDGVSQVMALALWRHPTHCDQWRLAVAGSHLSLIQPVPSPLDPVSYPTSLNSTSFLSSITRFYLVLPRHT